MPRDLLEQVLRNADASAPAAPLLNELPARVRRRHARRRTIQTLAAAAAMIALPLLLLVTLTRTPEPPTIAIDRRPAPPTRADLARIDLQAQLHEQRAARLLSIMPPIAPPPPVDDSAVLAHVRQQRDRAALVLIYDADQAARQKQTKRAVAAYRRTIELFPKTYAAAVARQRLKEIPS